VSSEQQPLQDAVFIDAPPLLAFENLDTLLRMLREVPEGLVLRVGYLDAARGDIVALTAADLRCRHGGGEVRP
jgi:hypothetical protein